MPPDAQIAEIWPLRLGQVVWGDARRSFEAGAWQLSWQSFRYIWAVSSERIAFMLALLQLWLSDDRRLLHLVLVGDGVQ